MDQILKKYQQQPLKRVFLMPLQMAMVLYVPFL